MTYNRVPTNSEKSRRRNDAIQRSVRDRQASMRCPKCGRGSAIKRTVDDMGTARTCRYCDYESFRFWGDKLESES